MKTKIKMTNKLDKSKIIRVYNYIKDSTKLVSITNINVDNNIKSVEITNSIVSLLLYLNVIEEMRTYKNMKVYRYCNQEPIIDRFNNLSKIKNIKKITNDTR